MKKYRNFKHKYRNFEGDTNIGFSTGQYRDFKAEYRNIDFLKWNIATICGNIEYRDLPLPGAYWWGSIIDDFVIE